MSARRDHLLSLGGGLLGVPLRSLAQSARPTPRIGLLFSGVAPDSNGGAAAFQRSFIAGMHELGWDQGRNLAVEARYGQNDPQRIGALARELVDAGVDVIVAADNMAIGAAHEATRATPVVMVIGLDPVGMGFVSSLARPGGNVTGLAWEQDAGMTAKYPELLKEAVPRMTRLGCLIDPRFTGIARYRTVLESAAARLGLSVEHAEVRSLEDIERAVPALASRGAQGLFVYGANLAYRHLARIVSLAATHRLPDMYIYREAVQMGGLLSYGTNIGDLFRRSAGYVDKILKGANPGELPVAMPTLYELVINRRRLAALGLSLPATLRARVDELVE
jgi:putative ABC transport system substrate-binding protein